MISRQRLATITATVGIAFGTAHVMQFGLFGLGENTPTQVQSVVPTEVAQLEPIVVTSEVLEVLSADLGDVFPSAPVPAQLAAIDIETRFRRPVPDDAIRVPFNAAHSNLNSFGIPCDRTLELSAAPHGSLAVNFIAGCNTSERVTVSHAGIVFAVQSSVLGVVALEIPALTRQAMVEVTLEDGTTLTDSVLVPDADSFDRVALQIEGEAAMALHAFEFGASYGDPGHVTFARPTPVQALTPGPKGEVILLGDPEVEQPVSTEIYSFPRGQATRGGAVRLHIEAEVTPFSCGRVLDANVVQTEPGDNVRTVAFALEMPGCDAVGDILVLKNVLRDLKIALN